MNHTGFLVQPLRAALLLALTFVIFALALPRLADAAIDLNERPQVRYQGQASEWLGSYVANQACDVNGDGYDDLLLSSEKWNGNAGELTVILGSGDPQGGDITSPTTGGVVRIQGLGRFGGAVDCAGDVNNDGIQDIIVGGYQYGHASGNPGRGSAWVIFGAEDFAQKALQFLPGDPGDTGYRIDGNPASATYNDDGLGFGVAGIGDVNGDGFDDLLLSAHLADGDGFTNAGSAYIVPGKATTSVVKLADPANWLVRVKGVKANNQMRGTTAVGDINGDGVPDAAVGTNLDTPYSRGSLTGSVWVIDGTARGEFSLNVLDPNNASYDSTKGFRIAGQAAEGGSSYGLGIGQHIAGVGDVNGDGKPDLMSNGWHDVTQGGPPIVFGATGNFERDLGAATWCDCGYQINGDGGSQVVGLGDVDGDGKDDVAFGNQGAANSNAAYLTYGRDSYEPLLLSTLTPEQGSKLLPAAGSASAGSGSRFGTRIGKADFNGDGAQDLVVGASNANGLGRTESGEVTVVFMPAPAKTHLDKESVDFGDLVLGSGPSGEQTVTLTNQGEKPLTIDSVELGGDTDDFTLDGGDCAVTDPEDSVILEASDSCVMNVAFAPQSSGPKQATITITGTDGSHEIDLTGNAKEPLVPQAVVSRSSVDFGSVHANLGEPSGETQVTLSNEGTADLTVGSITLGGTNPGDFSLDKSDCDAGSGVLAPDGECDVTVGFQPSATGPRSATVSFETDGGDLALALAGTGALPHGTVTPADVEFGETDLGQSSTRTFTLESDGELPLSIESADVTGANRDDFRLDSSACAATLAPGSSCEIGVTFTPTATGARSAVASVATDAGEITAALSGVGTQGTDQPGECPAPKVTRVGGQSLSGKGRGRALVLALRTNHRAEAEVSGTGTYRAGGKRHSLKLRSHRVKVGPNRGRTTWKVGSRVPAHTKVTVSLRIRTRPAAKGCVSVKGPVTIRKTAIRVSRTAG